MGSGPVNGDEGTEKAFPFDQSSGAKRLLPESGFQPGQGVHTIDFKRMAANRRPLGMPVLRKGKKEGKLGQLAGSILNQLCRYLQSDRPLVCPLTMLCE
jgi:hypothetical protein